MNYLKTILSLLLISTISASLYSDQNIENYYSSINFDYAYSKGDLGGDGYQLGLIYQLTGGENSGLALILNSSSLKVDSIDDVSIDPTLDLEVEDTSYGLGYIFKNADWHVIPYFTFNDSDIELTGSLADFDVTLESTNFGIMFRKSLSSTLSITYDVSIIDFDNTTVTVDGEDLVLDGSETAISLRLDQLITDELSLVYGAEHIDGVNTFLAGLSYTF